MKLHRVAEDEVETLYAFHCPACGHAHMLPLRGPRAWIWNGSMDKPTITPSIRTWGKQDMSDQCHSYITEGKIFFCADSCHELRGQTVELPEWESQWDSQYTSPNLKN